MKWLVSGTNIDDTPAGYALSSLHIPCLSSIWPSVVGFYRHSHSLCLPALSRPHA